MLNTLLIFIIFILIINILIRLYNIYSYSYRFSIDISKYIDIAYMKPIHYIAFDLIYSNPLLFWKTNEFYLTFLNSLLYLINNDDVYKNKNLCIIFCEYYPNNKLNVIIKFI